MRYTKIENNLFNKNRKKVRGKLKNNALAVINSNDQMPKNGDQEYKYRQNSDFFYLTGIEQEKSMLILDSGAKESREILFILKPDKKTEQWEGHKLTKDEARDISGVKNVQYINSFDAVFRALVIEREFIYLNNNEYSKYFTDVPYKDFRFLKKIQDQYPLHKYERLSPILTECRLIKEPEEIDLHQKACDITTDAFKRVAKFIKPGVYEYEIEAEMTHEYIRNGANGHAYLPIVASGKDSCVLHYISNDKQCKDGDLVLMDFGAEYANYSADTTRTLPVNGKFTKRQREVYEAVLRVMKKAIQLIKPGNTINIVNNKVNEYIEEELISLGLLTKSDIENQEADNPARMKYFMHGTSHFMGLDVHDVGGKDTAFKPGMFMSCEPGIYIEDENLGIRLEDDILVTANGQTNLLSKEPIEPDDIEALMS
ncbi:MAG: aminopeptidase P N-terminal domain-containing protein [Bacteroidota bacterium]|nr:aminopeptidase P N-terminal domain-containing protein [Bacteroidota bacterium]